jgi:hypothetical protein
VWLKAIAEGDIVETNSGTQSFEPALKFPRSYVLGGEFRRKHASLAKALVALTTHRGSQWRLDTGSRASTPAFRIERKRDLVEFLLRARRFRRRPV